MSTLGIGARVYIGYHPGAEDSCRTGVITDGPFPPRHNFISARDDLVHFDTTTWAVCLDVDGGWAAVEEYLLTPIDDDAETIVTEKREEAPA